MAALVALPSLWVDQEPAEIVTGLLSVLFGILPLAGAYTRFDGGAQREALEARRPDAPLPTAVQDILGATVPGSGLVIRDVAETEQHAARIACLSLPLPWETGVVVAWSTRPDFPTSTETHLLRVASGQAAIALHTARRLGAEHALRTAAEDALRRQRAHLRTIVDELGPALESLTGRLGDATRHLEGLAPSSAEPIPSFRPSDSAGTTAADETPPLSGREAEVLGLLAQGLSNREIAGVLWLSDRTVERHITSLYRKIGVARRSEATAFALRHGLS